MSKKLTQLRFLCEKTKIAVNDKETDDDNSYQSFLEKNKTQNYEISVEEIVANLNNDIISLDFKIVTEAFMNCLRNAIKPLHCITSKPGQRIDELKHVLLVGGSSKLLAFRQLLYREGFKKSQFEQVDPMTCVAQGAYLLAEMFNDPRNRLFVTEKIAISYGLKSKDNQVAFLLKKGDKIPAISKAVLFKNVLDYPGVIEIAAYQCVEDEGKRMVDIDKCTLIKTWRFKNPKNFRQPKGEQLLELQFKLNIGGTLIVTCKDIAHKKLLLHGETSVIYESQCDVC